MWLRAAQNAPSPRPSPPVDGGAPAGPWGHMGPPVKGLAALTPCVLRKRLFGMLCVNDQPVLTRSLAASRRSACCLRPALGLRPDHSPTSRPKRVFIRSDILCNFVAGGIASLFGNSFSRISIEALSMKSNAPITEKVSIAVNPASLAISLKAAGGNKNRWRGTSSPRHY